VKANRNQPSFTGTISHQPVFMMLVASRSRDDQTLRAFWGSFVKFRSTEAGRAEKTLTAIRKRGYVAPWHNERARFRTFEGTESGGLPTLGIEGRFKVYGVGLEPMSALANSTFDRAGAANGGSPPIVSNAALFTKVAFGLLAAIRCTVHEGPQWADCDKCPSGAR
jgi:hypothetical protein